MFKIGDVVVYPIHGVARITDIKKEKIGDSDQLCYVLETELKSVTREAGNQAAGRQGGIQQREKNCRRG